MKVLKGCSRFIRILVPLELALFLVVSVIDLFAIVIVLFTILFQIIPMILISHYLRREKFNKNTWIFELAYLITFSSIMGFVIHHKADNQIVILQDTSRYIIFLDSPKEFEDTLRIDSSGIGFTSLDWADAVQRIKFSSHDSKLQAYKNIAMPIDHLVEGITAIYGGTGSDESIERFKDSSFNLLETGKLDSMME